MEWFLMQTTKYERYYNCNVYNIEDIPVENRRKQWLGIGFIILTTVYQLLYVPCVFSIWKHMSNSYCYRIMFYISLVDMLTMVVNGWLTGFFGYIGAVYCSYPRLIFISGAIGLGCWCAESTMEVVLALNRCIELWSSDLAHKIFSGKKLWLWIGLPTVYGLWHVIFLPPLLFSGVHMAWFFNPHVGYIEDHDNIYENLPHTIHNVTLLCSLVVTYLAFCIILFTQSLGNHLSSQQSTYSQKMIFLQVLLISIINALAASIYVYMNYFNINETLILLGQFCWLNAHGVPPVIYLIMNKAIQRDCKEMLFRAIGIKSSQKVSPLTGGSTPKNMVISSVNTPTKDHPFVLQQQQAFCGNPK